jgi:putative membrane protein insertion efficiency factor
MKPVNWLAIAIIKVYQNTLGAFLVPSCRFHPTCSNYAIEVFRHLPPLRAAILSLRRIIRCNPWNPGGYDPPPLRKE